MIYRNGKLITEVQNNIIELVDKIEKQVQRKIGAIHKGSQLVWMTVYNAVRSCFGAGYWRGDKPWDGSDAWKG